MAQEFMKQLIRQINKEAWKNKVKDIQWNDTGEVLYTFNDGSQVEFTENKIELFSENFSYQF